MASRSRLLGRLRRLRTSLSKGRRLVNGKAMAKTSVVTSGLNVGKGSLPIKKVGGKDVSSSVDKPMSRYKNTLGPRDETGTKGS